QSPFLEGSLRMLANKIGIPYSTFKEVLRKSNFLFKQTKGKGRAAVTFLTSRSMLFNYLIQIKTQGVDVIQQVFAEFFPSTTKFHIAGTDSQSNFVPYVDTS